MRRPPPIPATAPNRVFSRTSGSRVIPERLVNFAHRAHHLLAVTSKQIVKAYYAKPAARAYYSGCSSGGWEGLSEAQRYPDDYDGIVAGARQSISCRFSRAAFSSRK